jgi:hypothetical protein
MKRLLLIYLVVVSSCNNSSFTGVKYYQSFTGYKHPVRLKGEVSINSISDSISYYRGYYKDDILIKVEKMWKGKIEYSYTYIYDDDGNYVEAITTK